VGERVIGLAAVGDGLLAGSAALALGTRSGQVTVTKPEWPARSDGFEVIGLADGDEVVGVAWLHDTTDTVVFISSDGQVLRFNAGKVRPQGLSGGVMSE